MTLRAQLIHYFSTLHWLLISLLLSATASAAILEVQPGPFRSGKAFVHTTFDGVREACFLDTGSAVTVLANSESFSGYASLGRFRLRSASGTAGDLERIQIRTAT